jgi:hypothetical protein
VSFHLASRGLGLCLALAAIALLGASCGKSQHMADHPDVYAQSAAGYVAANSRFTSISAQWVQPRVTRKDSRVRIASIWVGLNSRSAHKVAQIGTDCGSLGEARPHYVAWYEMYPERAVILDMKIRPGDLIFGKVSRIGADEFALQLRDESSGRSFSIVKEMKQPDIDSVCVCVEDPRGPRGWRFAWFSPLRFSNLLVNGKPITQFPWSTEVMLTPQGDEPVRISPLANHGLNFSITRLP